MLKPNQLEVLINLLPYILKDKSFKNVDSALQAYSKNLNISYKDLKSIKNKTLQELFDDIRKQESSGVA